MDINSGKITLKLLDNSLIDIASNFVGVEPVGKL